MNAISSAATAAATYIHQPMFTRYAKSFSQSLKNHHANGNAMIDAMITSTTNSFEINVTIFPTLAPITFLIPISLVRLTTASVANPNSPMHAINMEIADAIFTMSLVRASCWYCAAMVSSRNWYSKSCVGATFFQASFRRLMIAAKSPPFNLTEMRG